MSKTLPSKKRSKNNHKIIIVGNFQDVHLILYTVYIQAKKQPFVYFGRNSTFVLVIFVSHVLAKIFGGGLGGLSPVACNPQYGGGKRKSHFRSAGLGGRPQIRESSGNHPLICAFCLNSHYFRYNSGWSSTL